MLNKELEKLGLSEKEANVYLAAIQTGPSSVQKIAQKSKVNRATTYVIIESLMEMGMMSTYDEGKKTFYTAEKPHRLIEYFSQKEEELHEKIDKLKKIVPELNLLYNDFSDKPKVRYFEGIEGLKTVYNDFVDSLDENETIYIFLPYDEFDSSVLKNSLKGARQRRVAKNIDTKIIYTSKDGRKMDYEITGKREKKECLFVPFEKYPFRGGMNVYGNRIFMIDYLGKLGGVVIENKTLAEMLRNMFKIIWDKS
jgi:HTH-type transcriptional regulator, sugar sensing transcriptional regulator